MIKDAVVLFPFLGMGHLTPMVELAKLFITHNHNLSVTILLLSPPYPTPPATESFITRLSSTHPLISFHRLPKPQLPPPPPSSTIITQVFDTFRHSNPFILDFLQTLSQSYAVRAFILGMFCTPALDVARELALPAFFFFASAASALTVFLYAPTMQSRLTTKLKDMGDETLHLPGFPPVPASHMPDLLQDHESEGNKVLMFHFERIPKGDGIIVNTFEELEPRALQALVDGLCVSPGQEMPPLYCIGPLITETAEEEEKHECLKWLDEQPEGSVVFLCFGSMGSLSMEQLKEIAIGLEKSGQRFLWVVRSPPSDDPTQRFEPKPEPDLNVLMPEGFLERTDGRGMVVKSWAPQAAVLRHDSVGGFVTHCGWNSTLEAVSTGVAMIAWPLYAEQKMNKVFLVDEAKLAVGMEGYDKDLVKAEEVETKVRWLMESEGGKELKDRAAAMKQIAVSARKDGGSSDKAWRKLMEVLQVGI